MRRQIPRVELSSALHAVGLAFLLLVVLPASSRAQAELRADKQILLESTHGTMTLKKGPGDKLYVLNRSVLPSSSVWVSDYSGTSMRRILGGGTEREDLRVPKDLAVDRDGHVIVADVSIKVFSGDGKLLNSFPFDRSRSVGVLSDGRILVSGLPKDHLVSVFDRQGRLLGYVGQPAKVDDDSFFNAVLNAGSIVVDEDDNIYYIFRFLLTPTVRKYARGGKLVAEWHPQGAYLDQIVAQTKQKYEESKAKGAYGVSPVLTVAAIDTDAKTLWVASGTQVSELDSSGKTIRSLVLLRPDSGPLQADGLLVDRDFIRATTVLHGAFEFFKPH